MASLIHPRLFDRLGQFFPSQVTIQEAVVTRNAVGEEVVTWQDLGGHVAIPAAMAALSTAELRRDTSTILTSVRHVTLRGHYPSITTRHRAVVDGTAYNIIAVEHDSHAMLTRLRIEVVE